jgi:hypothetical protein
MPGVPWKKLGRVVAYMRAALSPTSEQLTGWDAAGEEALRKEGSKEGRSC